MRNTDMILMQAYTTFSKSVVSDIWSTSNRSFPQFDSKDDLLNKNYSEDTTRNT